MKRDDVPHFLKSTADTKINLDFIVLLLFSNNV